MISVKQMQYAPVIIPTLNRAEHLKRCLTSLGRNTGAEHTEVFVSVDFPPAEKYKEGYEQVKSVLQSIDSSCFKKLHIIYQEQNLGAMRNSEFLYNLISSDFDRYIYSEDDNEFSPNFLEYVNQGLEMFASDPNVLAICGAKDTDWETNGQSVALTKLYAAYGVGGWLKKRAELRDRITNLVLSEKVYGPGVMWNLFKRNRCLFNIYVLGIICSDHGFFWRGENDLRICDSVYSLYMHLSDGVCVAPAKCKSRTWGNDGSGVNMQKQDIDPEKEWPLDSDTAFAYPAREDLRFLEENYALGNAYMPTGGLLRTLKALAAYCVVLLCGRNREKVLRFRRAIRKN